MGQVPPYAFGRAMLTTEYDLRAGDVDVGWALAHRQDVGGASPTLHFCAGRAHHEGHRDHEGEFLLAVLLSPILAQQLRF